MQRERPGRLGARAHVLACDDGFVMRTAVQVPFPTQEPLCSLSCGEGSGLGCRGSATRPGTVLEGTWRAEFTAGASPSCHVSDRDSQSGSAAWRLARSGAEPPSAPVRRPLLTCLQMFSPEPRTQQSVAKGKTRMPSPLQSPGDEGRPARQACGVPGLVSGKRPRAGATSKYQHPTPGPIRAKEAVPLRPPPPIPRDGGSPRDQGSRHQHRGSRPEETGDWYSVQGLLRGWPHHAGRAPPSLGEPRLPSPSPSVVRGSVQLRATPGGAEPRRQLSGKGAHPPREQGQDPVPSSPPLSSCLSVALPHCSAELVGLTTTRFASLGPSSGPAQTAG